MALRLLKVPTTLAGKIPSLPYPTPSYRFDRAERRPSERGRPYGRCVKRYPVSEARIRQRGLQVLNAIQCSLPDRGEDAMPGSLRRACYEPQAPNGQTAEQHFRTNLMNRFFPRHRLHRSLSITIWNKVKLHFKRVHTTSPNARDLGHDFAKFYFRVVADRRHRQK